MSVPTSPPIFAFIGELVGTTDQTTRFIFAFTFKLTVPLQGLFNCGIYIRPRYILLRAQQGDTASFFDLLWCIIIGRDRNAGEHAAAEQIDEFAPELGGYESDESSATGGARSIIWYRSSFFETDRGQSVGSSLETRNSRRSARRGTNITSSDARCSE